MHARAAHLLERRLLRDHLRHHARRAEVHARVALDHHDDVAERRDVGAARGGRPEQQAHLRHPPRHAHLVVEDPPGAAPAREHLDLVGDPRARGVDEIDERHAAALRALLDAQDLLDRALAPRARLHGRVVRHHAHGPAVDPAGARHHAVRGQVAREAVRERGVLHERARVEQQREPLAAEQLALAARLLVIFRVAAAADLREPLERVLLPLHLITPPLARPHLMASLAFGSLREACTAR